MTETNETNERRPIYRVRHRATGDVGLVLLGGNTPTPTVGWGDGSMTVVHWTEIERLVPAARDPACPT